MARTVRAALIQAHANLPKEDALAKHVELVEEAAGKGAEVTCLQEIFFGPYFCAEQDPRWFDTAEPDDGPTVTTMRKLARRHEMVLVVPFFEKELEGVFYNTAVVIDADGGGAGEVPQDAHPAGRPDLLREALRRRPQQPGGRRGCARTRGRCAGRRLPHSRPRVTLGRGIPPYA